MSSRDLRRKKQNAHKFRSYEALTYKNPRLKEWNTRLKEWNSTVGHIHWKSKLLKMKMHTRINIKHWILVSSTNPSPSFYSLATGRCLYCDISTKGVQILLARTQASTWEATPTGSSWTRFNQVNWIQLDHGRVKGWVRFSKCCF